MSKKAVFMLVYNLKVPDLQVCAPGLERGVVNSVHVGVITKYGSTL